jgi:hypothetical protein
MFDSIQDVLAGIPALMGSANHPRMPGVDFRHSDRVRSQAH